MKNDNLDEYDKKEQSEQAFIGYEEQSRYLYSFEGPQVSPSLALSDNDRSAIMAQPTSHPHQPSAVQYCSLTEVITSGFPNVDKAIRISSDSSLLSGLKMCSTTSQVLAILREAVLSLSENNRRLQDRLSQVSGSAQLQQYSYPGQDVMQMSHRPQQQQIYIDPMYQIPAANPQRDFHTQQYTVTPSIYNSRADISASSHQPIWGVSNLNEFCLPSPPSRHVDNSVPTVDSFSSTISSSSSSSSWQVTKNEETRSRRKRSEEELRVRSKETNASDSSSSSTRASDTEKRLRANKFWTKEEHKLFLEGIKKYHEPNIHGAPVDDQRRVGLGQGIAELIAEHVKTRSVAQVRSHAQKYFIKQWKHKDGQEEVKKEDEEKEEKEEEM